MLETNEQPFQAEEREAFFLTELRKNPIERGKKGLFFFNHSYYRLFC